MTGNYVSIIVPMVGNVQWVFQNFYRLDFSANYEFEQ